MKFLKKQQQIAKLSSIPPSVTPISWKRTENLPASTVSSLSIPNAFEQQLKSPEASPLSIQSRSPMQASTPKSAQEILNFSFASPVIRNKRPINTEAIHVTAAKKLQTQNVFDKRAEGKAMVFGLVQNLAFIVVRDGSESKTFFKCNIPGCRFKLMEENSLHDHFEIAHKNGIVKWSGFCGICAKINLYPEKLTITIFDEIEHIQKIHTLQQTSPFSPSFHPRFIASKDPRKNSYSTENICNEIESINLRPWLEENVSKKTKQAAIAMLHENSLAAFFKCMQKDCVFFTCDLDIFRAHLTHHKNQNDVLLCSYCTFRSNTIDDLTGHLTSEHAYDVFQCAFCFYRCVGEYNFMTHAKQYHSDKQSIVMIECFRRSFKDTRDRLMNESRSEDNVKKFVPKLVCNCGVSFYIFVFFEKHIREHDLSAVKQCEKCNEKVPLKDIIEHYEKCMKVSCYQCLYCNYGAQNHFKMYEHLSRIHPSKFPLYCDRMDYNSKVSILITLSPVRLPAVN